MSDSIRRSVTGRPRALTDAQVLDVLAWHDSRMTLRQKAAELGISPGTLQNVIRTRGEHYKQPSPEQRANTLRTSRARRAELRAAGLM
jgi:hypothetical protein